MTFPEKTAVQGCFRIEMQIRLWKRPAVSTIRAYSAGKGCFCLGSPKEDSIHSERRTLIGSRLDARRAGI